eukprot:6969731-Alexandrium_andersonii.AAC.1
MATKGVLSCSAPLCTLGFRSAPSSLTMPKAVLGRINLLDTVVHVKIWAQRTARGISSSWPDAD